jgi:aspartyl-tRNA(Asn)/glutamyl-tRNA(Gln) amidotransferase subunit C
VVDQHCTKAVYTTAVYRAVPHAGQRSMRTSNGGSTCVFSAKMLDPFVIDSDLDACSWASFLRAIGQCVEMELTTAEVRYVAALARLGLSDAEIALMQQQLSSILGHISALNELDVEAISPTAHVIQLTNVWREDEVTGSLSREDVLRNAPRQDAGCFEVHTPLGGEELVP